jgi:hypothetical protein
VSNKIKRLPTHNLGGILVLEADDLNHAIQFDVHAPGCKRGLS